MKELDQLQIEIKRAKAQLDELLISEDFTEKDVELLAPRYALNIQALHRQQKQLEKEQDTLNALNIEVNEPVVVSC